MKRTLIHTISCIIFSSLAAACAAPPHVAAASPDPAPAAERVVIEGFGGGAEPVFMGELSFTGELSPR
jgi:hypothetical protein